MLSNMEGNKEYVDYVFENHRLFFCDSLPWQFYNYENAQSPRTTSLNVRLIYLFSKQGFFNRMELEKNNKNIFNLIPVLEEERAFFCFFYKSK